MTYDKAPIFESLLIHLNKAPVSFHVPGHKMENMLDARANEFFKEIRQVDMTELPGLDDLHAPNGAIKKAQELAAKCFGAEETYFLVGGSTAGNLAAVTAICDRGDILIVQRNVHKSIIHGLMLAGAKVIFLPPMIDPETGLATGVMSDHVKEALKKYPQAKALILCNPNYYGMGIELERIANEVHTHDIPLIVDEAHGAHYGFHPDIPASALRSGADLVIQSTHKMLTALTMGAMLHVQGRLIDRKLLAQRLSMLQSSSPSYPILASLDLARRDIHTNGYHLLSEGLKAVEHFTDLMDEVEGFQIIAGKWSASTAYQTKDRFKVLVKDGTGTLTGYRILEELSSLGCFAEMADPIHVLLVFSLASKKQEAEKLAAAFRQISDNFALNKKELKLCITNTYRIEAVPVLFSPISFDLSLVGFTKDHVITVPLHLAVNCRSAEMIIPYPPGIPVLYPGETISQDMMKYLQKLANMGAKFQGAQDQALAQISVLK
jgi:arginine decarboxylase